MSSAIPAQIPGDQQTSRPDVSILAGKRVVIVEDEEYERLELIRTLSEAGMVLVGSADNGEDGVRGVLKMRPDIVLLDVRMPVMDGFEAAADILSAYPVCIVMLTAFEWEDYVQRARFVGISDYVLKPLVADKLPERLAAAYLRYEQKHEARGHGA